jgi:hypothetical protein
MLDISTYDISKSDTKCQGAGLASFVFLPAPPRKRLPHPSRFRRVGGTNQDSIGFSTAPLHSAS